MREEAYLSKKLYKTIKLERLYVLLMGMMYEDTKAFL